MFFLPVVIVLATLQDQDAAERKAAALIQQLRSNNPADRDEAGRELKDLGKTAVPLLEKVVADPDIEVAARARRVLQGIAVRAHLTPNLLRVIPGIEEHLVSGSETKWSEAFQDAISEIDGKRVYPSLKRDDLEVLAGPAIRGLQDSELPEVRAIFDAIAERGLRSAIPDLISLVRNRAEGYQWALQALRELRPPEAVPALVSLLEDSVSTVSSDAVWVLQDIGTRGVVLELRRLLTMKNSHRLQIFEALISLDAGEALPEMLAVLQDESPEVRARAAFELANLQLAGSANSLGDLLKDKNIEVRESAARALAKMKVPLAFSPLLELLGNADPHIREQACFGLGDLGTPECLPPLRRLLKDPDKNVRGTAAFALREFADSASIPDLIEALKDPEEQVRGWSVSNLGRRRALNAISEIRPLLKDESDMVRRWSAMALAALGDKKSIPEIAKALEDLGIDGVYALRDLDARDQARDIAKLLAVSGGDGQIRRAAGEALGYFRARQEIPSIQKLLTEADYGIRRDAVLALSHVGDRQTIQAIRPLLQDDHPEVRTAAIQSLERLGDGESDRVLGDLLNDPFTSVRLAAAESLCRRGLKEGVPILLRDGWNLTVLNAIRMPEAWKKMAGTLKSPISVEGPVQMILTRVGYEAGLKIDLPSKDRHIDTWLGLHKWSTESLSPLEIFEDISRNGMYTFILEGEGMRILPREEAVPFWSDWWKNQNSKGK